MSLDWALANWGQLFLNGFKHKNFSQLDVSNVGISDTIPTWFWNLSSNIQFLNLSHNPIIGTIPLQWFLTRFIGSPIIDLSYNCLSEPLP
jgi:EIX receptor 1/2